MLFRTLTLLAVALMAFGGSASALSTGYVKVHDPMPCAGQNQMIFKEITLQLVVGPGAQIVLAGNTAGTVGLYPFYGGISITVQHGDPTSQPSSGTYWHASGGGCTVNSFPTYDVSGLFKPGLETVKITLMGARDPNGLFYYWAPTLYLVATSSPPGTLVAPTA